MEGTRVILDFPVGARNGSPMAFGTPRRVYTARALDEVRPALRAAAHAAREGAHVVGFVAYEAAPAFDPACRVIAPAGPLPLLWFGAFDPPTPAAAAEAVMPSLDWQIDTPRADYDDAVRAIRAAIGDGDVYQVNHTIRLHARCAAAPAALFHALSAQRHGRYHALIETPGWAIVSASPELFIDLHDGLLTTRPMKGTARRGRWLQEDRHAAAALASSAKDRAENLMIVDLLRNDLGRVAQYGSVHVAGMFDIETYPTVHQMTSTITAQLRADCTLDDVFAAMFPCGSVTGAPKLAAMHKIVELERAPRGAYCGAVGIIRPDGSATFNVAIRTLTLDRHANTAVYGSGGGITWDSAPAAEYDELIAKAALLTASEPPFGLFETMRMDDGTIPRIDLHLARLAESCAYWGFAPVTPGNARARLHEIALRHPEGSWRVRLTAAATGEVDCVATPLTEARARTPLTAVNQYDARRVVLAHAPVHSSDRLLHHKTTARAPYDERRDRCPDAFDVLLHNEHGHITEFTIGNVVCEIDGVLVTPPRADGLLNGCFREQLLRAGEIVERSIGIEEARTCTRMWLINSVREWVAVRLADEERAEPREVSAL